MVLVNKSQSACLDFPNIKVDEMVRNRNPKPKKIDPSIEQMKLNTRKYRIVPRIKTRFRETSSRLRISMTFNFIICRPGVRPFLKMIIHQINQTIPKLKAAINQFNAQARNLLPGVATCKLNAPEDSKCSQGSVEKLNLSPNYIF